MKIVRNFGLVTALSLALLLLGGGVVSAQSTSTNQTVEELQAQIEQLEQQVESLRAQIDAEEEDMEDEDEDEEEEESEEEEDDDETGTSTEERESLPPQAAEQARIARQLSMGDRGPDVQRLQELLATNSEIYPEGLTTGYFGQLTSQAVTRLQERIGLNADGEVGSTTLSEINTLLTEGAGQTGMVPPGLLKAPGLWKDRNGDDDDTGTSSEATSTEEAADEDDDESDDADDESSESTGMPDWDQLPIDNELKNRMNSMFGGQGQGGNPGQGGGR